MSEFRRNSCSFHRIEYFHIFNGFFLKLDRVGHRCCDSVPCHIEISEIQLANARVGSTKLRSSNNLINHLLRNLFSGLIVLCKAVEEFFLSKVVLIELRRQFHKIMEHTCARKRRILAVRKQTMQCVTKLMQESLYLVVCQERRLIIGRRGKISNYGNKRTNILTIFVDALTRKFGHPSATTLSVAWEEVGIKHTHKLSVFVAYIIYFHIGVIYLRVVIFHKLQTVHLGSKTKHTLYNIV